MKNNLTSADGVKWVESNVPQAINWQSIDLTVFIPSGLKRSQQ